MPLLTVAGRALEYEWIGAGDAARPVLVFLHEGLGSIRQWQEFPSRLAQATGCRALAYNRHGYGHSAVLDAPRAPSYMHDEARIVLPELLRALEIREPVLIGHSDGASIALIHAGSGHPLRGLVVEAPHVFVEDHGLRAIAEAKQAFASGDLAARLGRYHRDAAATFRGWNEVWLLPAFRDWNIEALLPEIRCPLLAIQGHEDRYGTMAQLDSIARGVRGPCELLKLERCGHAPHRDQPQATLDAMTRFIEMLRTTQAA